MIKRAAKYLFILLIVAIGLFALALGGYSIISARPFPMGSVVLNLGDGLGNIFFRYAAAYSLAKKTHSRLYIISNKADEEKGNVNVGDRNPALHLFNVPKENWLYRNKLRKVSFIDKYVTEGNFFELSNKRNFRVLIMSSDVFADKKFFEEYKNDILKFYIPNFSIKHLEPLINKVTKPNSVCVHVRRGDMLQNKMAINIEYQKKAMKLMSSLFANPQYFIFSDSVSLVKKELSESENVSYIHKPPVEDFVIMSKCSNHIIANSTFSWWAAYLNQNRNRVIMAPASGLYYGAYAHFPKEWMTID